MSYHGPYGAGIPAGQGQPVAVTVVDFGHAGRSGAKHLGFQRPEFRALEAQVLGPAPASVAKVNDRYRYRLTLACRNTRAVRAMVAHLVRCAQKDKENKGVSVSADVDPLD